MTRHSLFASFVAPISGLMHRLSFQHKFILAGGLMVVALGVALVPGLIRMAGDYGELKQRRTGVALIRGVLAGMEAVAAHRRVQLAGLRGLGGEGETAAAAQGVDLHLAALAVPEGSDAEAAAALAEVQGSWAEIRRRSAGRYSPVRAAADHAALLTALQRYLEFIASATGVGSETGAAAQLVAGLLVRDLPRLMLDMSDAHAHGIAAAAGVLNEEDRQRLGYLTLHLVREADAILEQQRLRLAAEPLAGGAERLAAAVPALANLLRNNAVLHPENQVAADDLAAAVRAAAGASADLTALAGEALLADLLRRHDYMVGWFAAQLAAIGIILAVATYVFFGFWHASRETINALVATTERVIGGDLSAEARVRSRDELAKIADRFNLLAQTLRGIIGGIAGHSRQVTEMAGQLHRSAALVIQNAEVQSKAATSTSVSVQQIAVGIASVNDNASDLAQLARQGITAVETGEAAVRDLNAQMRDVRDIMVRIAATSTSFVDDAHHVAAMTKRVKEISDQTNLLALNAAIEAARAGEHGRGFAVVADEVRKLAENVAATARQIDGVMTSMMQQSDEVTTTIEAGTSQLAEAEARLACVSVALDATGSTVRHTHRSVHDISRSIAEQKTASEDIARNVDGIANMAESTHGAVGTVYGLIRELTELTQQMNGHVARFQT